MNKAEIIDRIADNDLDVVSDVVSELIINAYNNKDTSLEVDNETEELSDVSD